MVRPFIGTTFATLLLASCTTLTTPYQTQSQISSSSAKNVILFIGDGMGISTITAARIFDGQSQGKMGEEHVLPFEEFPHLALVKTYNTNQQVPDSAGTATAMMTGEKTRAGVINIGPQALRNDCIGSKTNRLRSIGQDAVSRGIGVGIVTTARITHATPATIYAQSPERDWEADSNIPQAQRNKGCQDIATQLLSFPFDIALGGGLRNFVGEGKSGKRESFNEDLTVGWESAGGTLVTTHNELKAQKSDDRILGLFADSHLTYMLDRQDNSTEPTLTEMTSAAINHLNSNEKGYFLMVEGGRIDHGHHDGRAGYALTETQEFARSVQYAVDNTNPRDTLILVTADHSHVFAIAGYPTRGNPILGLVNGNDEHGEPTGKPILAADGAPYSTLGYINGPGAVSTANRPAPSTDITSLQQALIPTLSSPTGTDLSETHGGEDVALYATGPGAEKVHGVIEQNKIYEIMTSAFGWSD